MTVDVTDVREHVLCYSNNPVILGANNQNLPRILAIIAETLVKEVFPSDNDVGKKLILVVKQLQVNVLSLSGNVLLVMRISEKKSCVNLSDLICLCVADKSRDICSVFAAFKPRTDCSVVERTQLVTCTTLMQYVTHKTLMQLGTHTTLMQLVTHTTSHMTLS